MLKMRGASSLCGVLAGAAAVLGACGGGGGSGGAVDGGPFGGAGGAGSTGGSAGSTGGSAGSTGGAAGATGGAAGSTGGTGGAAGSAGAAGSGGSGGDPATCAEAAQVRSYLGCEFWPTVTANQVWSTFDFAVAVVNAGTTNASLTIERGASTVATGQVAPNDVAQFYLPWIPELKGPDSDTCGSVVPLTASARKTDGAYRLTSTVPVAVYQFNALEYKGEGGPPGKNWASCPGNQSCVAFGSPLGCFSFSNDASLLLPTTGLGSSYRVPSMPGWPAANISPFVSITGTANGTSVTVQLPASGGVSAGGGIPATAAGGSFTFPIGRGEVVQLLGTVSGDVSGALITSTQPVQVISGAPCMNQPITTSACDHLEESVLPAEALGKRYLVAQPSAPLGNVVGHVVRIYGHVNGTTLSYPGGAPAGAPTTIAAGQVVDLGHVTQNFEVIGSEPFGVATFMVGGSLQDPSAVSDAKGDPAQSTPMPVEQFRTKYVFFAPDDYDVSYADVVAPTGTTLTLDGAGVSQASVAFGNGYGIVRIPLSATGPTLHVLEASAPVGLQVMGFGSYTSYQYPGGANLALLPP